MSPVLSRPTRLALIATLITAGCGRGGSPPPTASEPAPPPLGGSATTTVDRADATPVGVTTTDAAPDLGPPSEALGPPPAALASAVRLEPVVSGLNRPVALVAVPGRPGRLFVVEQVGTIRVLDGGVLVDGAVLDLRREVSRGNEQGLLGLAFHPDFVTNRKLYVDYTDRGGDTHVVEFRLDDRTGQVDRASEREILHVDQPYSNHNGGHLLFGPDRRLWIGLGDGGDAGDPLGAGQSDRYRLAKMLRVDVDADPPTIEVAAKGLRNPWRYAFDAATGDLYIGDVGQNQWEQVYVVPHDRLLGHNFGWNVAEGRHCFARRGCDRSRFTAPVTDYRHDVGCSITGGMVYRGRALPALDGVYFYADYCTAVIRSFRWRPDGIRDHWEWKPVLDPDSTLAQISSFGVDHDGELYLLLLGGDVLRLAPR